MRNLLSPASWPGWLYWVYKAVDAWGNAGFIRGKANAMKSFVDSPWAIALGFAWLFIVAFGWHKKMWSRIPRTRPKDPPTEVSPSHQPQAIDGSPPAGANLSGEIRCHAAWWDTRLNAENSDLGRFALVSKRSVLWHRLTKKSAAQQCCIDFHFEVYSASVATVVLGGKPITGRLSYQGQLQDRPLSFEPPNFKLQIQPGTSAPFDVSQWLPRDTALDIWQSASEGTSTQEVVFNFGTVVIPIETILPDGTPGPSGRLLIPDEIRVQLPLRQQLGHWQH